MSGIITAMALAAAGTATESYANNQALKAQDNAAAEGILKQGALKQQANADVAKNITTAGKNQANVDTNQSALQEQYAAALNRGAPVQATQGVMPGASKRFAADTTAAIGANQTYGQGLASTAAAVGAPQLTNMQTQQGLGDTATKLGGLSDQSNQQAALTSLQVQAIKANPWLLGAGAVMQAGGSAGAAKYMYGAGAGADAGGAVSGTGASPLNYIPRN